MRTQLIVLLLLRVGTGIAAQQETTRWVDSLLEAHANGTPLPLISAEVPAMSVEEAYEIQHSYVQGRLRDDRIAGFKGASMSSANPMSGILFESGARIPNSTIGRSAFIAPMIETELGILVGKRISEPVPSEARLRDAISGFMPVVELPDGALTDMASAEPIDIIAANALSAQYISGTPVPRASIDPNEVGVTLFRDGVPVGRGAGTDSRGNQWEAALWLVNEIVGRGYKIEVGQILITGALGDVIPGQPGTYVADYGSLGRITFQVR